jgi:AraC-like DNA-binding protein
MTRRTDPLSAGQTYLEQQPLSTLDGAVSSAWIQQVSPDAPPYRHSNVPSGGVELVCQLGSVPRVIGPLTRAYGESLAPGTTRVGVRFFPGRAAALLKTSTSHFADLEVSADALWGSSAVVLAEQLAGCRTAQAALTLLQRFVARRIEDAPGPDPLVAEAMRQLMPRRSRKVASVRALIALSDSQLRRRFERAVGLTPKATHRILRFQGFLAMVQHSLARGVAPSRVDLARLAGDAGYADQSHLSRECVRLAGMPPRAFLRGVEEHCGDGHNHEVSFTTLLP